MKRSTIIVLNALFYSALSIMFLGIGVILEKTVFGYSVYINISNSIFSLLFFIINYSCILFMFKEKNELLIKGKTIFKGEVLSIGISASVIIAILQFSHLSLKISSVLFDEILLLVITPIIVLLINRKKTIKNKA